MGLKQLSYMIEHDRELKVERERTGESKLLYRDLHVDLIQDAVNANELLGFPNEEDIGGNMNAFIGSKISLKLDKEKLFTKHFAFIGEIEGLKNGINFELTDKASNLVNFMRENPNRFKAEYIITRVIYSDYVRDENPKSIEWFNKIIQENGVSSDFELYSSKKNRNPQEKYDHYKRAFEVAKSNADWINQNNFTFAADLLAQYINTGKITPKQDVYVEKLVNKLVGEFGEGGQPETLSEYQILKDKALDNMDIISKTPSLGFALKVLDTIIRTDKVTEKQEKYYLQLKNALRDM